VITDTITLDTTAPAGTIAISDASQAYSTHQVALTLSASDLISPVGDLQMQVSNGADFSEATWQPYATNLTWSLLPGTGDRTVYVRFRDAAGNISSYRATVTIKIYLFLPNVSR
jgi:hypothetical protein